MNKVAFALTTLAALAVARVAFAQEAGTDPQDPSKASATPTPAPADSSVTTITSAEPPPPPPVAPMVPLQQRETLVAKQSIRPNRPLLITGLSTFVGSYVTTAALTGAAVMRHGKADRTMYMPIAGPWLHLRTVREGTLDTLLIAGSGIIQAAGVAVSVLSLIIPEKIPAATIEAHGVTVNLTATSFGRGSAGVGATGQF